MKIVNVRALCCYVALLIPCYANTSERQPDNNIDEARSLVKEFAGDLKATLGQALQVGGPVNAIQVCHLQAEPIANAISIESSWLVKRTSLQTRNPDNMPDPWERKTLQRFEQQKAAGKNPKTLEYAELTEENGESVYRYMKAIPTAQVCLTCHGTTLHESVLVKLKELYPDDQAIGYNVGDIRGAFTLKKVKKSHAY